jgi:thiosulfate/3-mercaptopyruvate sulfurtransferase
MHGRFLLVMLLTLVAGLSWTCFPGESVASEPAFERVFVDVGRFEELRKEGAAVLDVRGSVDYRAAHVPGAAPAPWEAFVDGSATGLVSDDDAKLTTLLQAAGVRKDRPVLIYGNWSAKSAWGEEGRLLWMLHYLGHEDVYILQGGFRRWRQAGHEAARLSSTIPAGNFEVRRQHNRRARTQGLLEAVRAGSENIVFIDTREAVEYAGQIKYGEQRAGHIPGASHLWWHDLFRSDGTLRPADELRKLFEAQGVSAGKTIVPYCTGGIRSGFVYAVLVALGHETVQNYDGSMWEWTARSDTPVVVP